LPLVGSNHQETGFSSLRAATAARNCTSYRRPPAGAFSPYDCTSHLAFKTGSKPTACAASSAQHALRAQARCSTRSTRAAVQLATDCLSSGTKGAASFVALDSVPLAQLHPRKTPLRAAAANRPNWP
jgi:hypothetical protein